MRTLVALLTFIPVYILFRLAKNEMLVVVKATIVTELTGIKIAATTGDRYPCTAKVRPTILYKNESK